MFTTVALGSNLGDRADNLREAVAHLRELANDDSPVVISKVYSTDPIDCPPESPGFLNAVVGFSFDDTADELLVKLQEIETLMGRPGKRAVNAPRTIDLDILHFGDVVMKSDTLTLPHPRLHLRRFVLTPLADIAPDLLLPGHTGTVTELLASVDDPSMVVETTPIPTPSP